MLEALGRNREAVQAFRQIPQESELYMPAGYRILEVSVNDLLDATTMQASLRGRLANSLIGDLTGYMGRARAYASNVPDQERAKQALAWGAECGLLIAQLHKDVLNRPAEAMQRAKELADDPTWKQVPGIARRSQQFVVAVLLEAGQPEKVIPDLIALIKDDPAGAEKLLARAVGQIGERIERLMYSIDPAAERKLQELRKAYKIFAEELYRFVEQSGDVPAQQKAPFQQALAHAYEFGTQQEAQKSLELYLQLHGRNRNDADIIRGLARAYRVLGQPAKAMQYYNRLISGLPEKSSHWWRAQFKRLEYALEIYTGNKKELKKIPIQIRMLRDKDRDMGGYWQQFNKVEARAKEITGSASPAGAASRGSGF
jgi:tetratricopeptide (TPR) repeat protein